jgi:PIN domain nuclease of toxin-antitoxin system
VGRFSMILLDTCALLWLVKGEEVFSDVTMKRINNSAVVYISAISGFEIGIKYRSGKLMLPIPPTEWFLSAVKHHNISLLDLSAKICLKSTELPPIHKDPCDRFIIASALILNIPVVTKDTRFKEYSVDVLD